MGQNKRLTELQRNFVENIVESAGKKTATQCAIEAGYSPEAAVVYASKLQNPKLYPLVAKYIEELRVKKRENLDLVFIKHMDKLNSLLEIASEHLSKDLKNKKYRKVISVVKEIQPLHSFYGMSAIKVYLAEEARPYKTGHFKIGKTTQRKVEDRGKFTDNPYGMNYICYFEYVPSNGFNLEKNLHYFFRFYSTYNAEYSGSSEWFKIKNREKLIKTFKKVGNKLLEKNNCLSIFVMNNYEME